MGPKELSLVKQIRIIEINEIGTPVAYSSDGRSFQIPQELSEPLCSVLEEYGIAEKGNGIILGSTYFKIDEENLSTFLAEYRANSLNEKTQENGDPSIHIAVAMAYRLNGKRVRCLEALCTYNRQTGLDKLISGLGNGFRSTNGYKIPHKLASMGLRLQEPASTDLEVAESYNQLGTEKPINFLVAANLFLKANDVRKGKEALGKFLDSSGYKAILYHALSMYSR